MTFVQDDFELLFKMTSSNFCSLQVVKKIAILRAFKSIPLLLGESKTPNPEVQAPPTLALGVPPGSAHCWHPLATPSFQLLEGIALLLPGLTPGHPQISESEPTHPKAVLNPFMALGAPYLPSHVISLFLHSA